WRRSSCRPCRPRDLRPHERARWWTCGRTTRRGWTSAARQGVGRRWRRRECSMAVKRSPDRNGAYIAAPPERPIGEGAKDAIAESSRLKPSEILKILGPGIITGGADNDPAGVTTYSVVGAQNG